MSHTDPAGSRPRLEFPLDQTRRYLEVLGGGPDDIEVFQLFADRKELKDKLPAKTLIGRFADLADQLMRANLEGYGVFITVNQTDGKGRATENITGVRAAFIDHDLKDGPMKAPPKIAATMVVSSGHGSHSYFKYRDLQPVDGFKALQTALAGYHGTDGNVCDLPRVMRLPGFYNMKAEPVAVVLVSVTSDKLYTPDEIVAAYGFDLQPQAKKRSRASHRRYRPANGERVRAGCSFVGHCHSNRQALTEPQWFFGLRVAAHCEHGREIAHEISREHPGYTADSTDTKFDHAAKYGPPLCSDIAGELMWPGCASCPHHGKIVSPIVLGSNGIESISHDDAQGVIDEALAQLAEGKGEVLFSTDTLGALAALPQDERDQVLTRIRTIIEANKVLKKAVKWRTFEVRLKETIAQRQEEATHQRPSSDKREIMVSNRQLRDVVAECLEALSAANHPASLFVRNATLVVVHMDELGAPRISACDLGAIKLKLSHSADFYRYIGRSMVATSPPDEVCDALLGLGAWSGIPALTGVSTIPIARPDGSFHAEPGYDATSHLLYLPTRPQMPVVPENPTDEDIRQAVAALHYPFADFPLVDEIARTHVIAFILTLVMRMAIDGPVPVFIVLANLPGTGKSLLTEIAVMLVFGEALWTSFVPTNKDEEMRKRITTALLAGMPAVILDNAEGHINCAPLVSAITSTIYGDRILGSNTQARLRNNTVFSINGNNLGVGDDTGRRAVLIEMRSETEEPWGKDSYTIKDLRGWARQHAVAVLAAAMTLARAWHQRGAPEPVDLPALGGFEAWRHVIGGILQTAGIPGLLANRERTRELNEGNSSTWGAFLAAVYMTAHDVPFTVRDLVSRIQHETPLLQESMPSDLVSIRDNGDGKLQHALGQRLKRIVNSPYDGFVLRKAAPDPVHHVVRWAIECRRVERLPEPYRSAHALIGMLSRAQWWSAPEHSKRVGNRGVERQREDDISTIMTWLTKGSSLIVGPMPTIPLPLRVDEPSLLALRAGLRWMLLALGGGDKPLFGGADDYIDQLAERILEREAEA